MRNMALPMYMPSRTSVLFETQLPAGTRIDGRMARVAFEAALADEPREINKETTDPLLGEVVSSPR
jgi:hypothetical protein